MKRQCIIALEHIKHAGKHKALAYKEPVVEPKWARAPVRQPQEFVWASAPTVVRPPLPHVQPPSSSLTSMPAELSSQGEARLAPEISVLKAQPVAVESRGLSASLYALDVLGPTKHRRGRKPPLDLSKLDVVDFPDNVPAQAGPAQLLFMHAVLIPAPPPQFPVVILTTDPRMLEQYDGLVATQQKTAATFKGKGKAVATIEDESDYGQFLSEDKQESEGATAFEFNSHQQAKVPATIVYKYTLHSLLCTPYKLERLYKYYANKHIPHRDRVVVYMLISELLQFTQRLSDNLHDHTMQVILSDPIYWDLKNPI
ncbi:hypothetical protein C0995_008862 [Termitomyces sp. Mi166|nr:hypothetical protein C0995_008862 [Termitomyces sp. Mi166\